MNSLTMDSGHFSLQVDYRANCTDAVEVEHITIACGSLCWEANLPDLPQALQTEIVERCCEDLAERHEEYA